ncbi:MAG: YggT family protein [Candidatus Methylomirabilia bacterium]
MNIVVVQMINYTLSFLMWMIVGRGILELVLGNRQNIMLLAFVKVTEPVYRVTRKILPFASVKWTPVWSFFLLALVRLAMIVILHPAAGR